jgi:hypothetical protein
VSADSGANSAPPELGKAGPATFHPKTKNRSAVSALLDANEAIKLISSITPATAKRLAEEIASDPTMDENVRLSLAHRLTTQAKALSERPTTTMSSTSLHPAAFSASALSTMPHVKLVGGGGGDSDSRPQQHAFNPTASTGLFGNQQQALTSTALFPVQPAAEPDQMLLFAPDRNFDSAVATSMKRLSGIVQVCVAFILLPPVYVFSQFPVHSLSSYFSRQRFVRFPPPIRIESASKSCCDVKPQRRMPCAS